MRVIKATDYEEMSLRAAEIIRAQITLKPDSVLGLATGSTPVGLYKYLVKWHKEDGLDFSKITSVNLDEYKGLSPDHDQSYRYFMEDNLFSHVNIDKNKTNVPDGLASDEKAECERYDKLVASLGGQDLQLLGIGNNGHIGFNEPGEFFNEGTHCVKLTDSTIEANSRFFASKDEVPKFAFSMGIGTIMQAKAILIVASGKSKANAVKTMINGEIGPHCPATILRFHPNVIVVADEEALS